VEEDGAEVPADIDRCYLSEKKLSQINLQLYSVLLLVSGTL